MPDFAPDNQAPGGPGMQWGPTFGGTGETDFRLALKNQHQKSLIEAQNQPALAAEAGRQNRFNAAFGFGQQALAGLQNQFATAGGASGHSPEITVGGVMSPQMIQQQINAQRAHNEQGLGTQNLQQQTQLAGQGFGANSPLLASLQAQGRASTNALNATDARETRLGVAKDNAANLLQTQQAREGQFASRQKEDIERRKPIWSAYQGLLSSLTNMG